MLRKSNSKRQSTQGLIGGFDSFNSGQTASSKPRAAREPLLIDIINPQPNSSQQFYARVQATNARASRIKAVRRQAKQRGTKD